MLNDIAKWLEELGLGEYAALFDEQAIDTEVLPDLSDADLEKIGVKLGHRKKLLKAIAALDAEKTPVPTPIAAEPTPQTHRLEENLAAWERQPGERKPVTLLFVDIADSTALTEKLDAEETHELLYGATQRMCEAVENNRGTVCRFMGDGVMAMFGAPVASEQHAVDACEAALEMQQAIQDYATQLESRHGSGLQIRVGLHSGEVVVLTVGEGDTVEHDASGPTVPIAARMEQVANPGDIYMTDATRRLAETRVEVESLEPVSAKGISEPMPVFALRRVRSAEEARPSSTRTPFVGRRAELMQLRGMLEACLRGERHGQTVYIRGEPGIGKTRLVEELSSFAVEKGFSCHRGLVLPFGVGKGQDAIRSLVRSLLGVPVGSGKTERQRAADAALSDGRLVSDHAVFLNDLLDLPQPTTQRALYDAMDNTTRNEGKRSVASTLLAATSSIQPIVAVVEDVHWADAVTLANLAVLTKTVANCPALLVLTSRIDGDQLDHGWRATTQGSPFFTIDLGPLMMQDSIALISEFIDAGDPLAEGCLERAAGNPLFLEQLLRAAQEGSVEKLPDSVQSLVVARVDRLSPRDKRALQAASVVGQRFTLDLVRHLLNDAGYLCDQLVAHSLVRAEATSYLFAHALIQEGVYSSILKRDRANLHEAAAGWFSERDPVLRAEHLDRAGNPAAAQGYLLAAKSQAEAYRFDGALRLAERGYRVADEPRMKHQLACLKGELLHDTGVSEASIATYRAALHDAMDEVSRCEALVGVAAGMRLTTDYAGAMRYLDEAEPIAKRTALPKLLARMHHLRGNVCFSLGKIERCRKEHSLALQFARDAGLGELEARALGGLGDAAYAAGKMRTALEHYTACLALCREQAYGRIEIAYLAMVPFSLMYLCQHEQAMRGAIAAVEAARKARHDRAEMNALGAICHIALTTGEVEPVAECAKKGLYLADKLGAKAWVPLFLLWRGLTEEVSGRLESARDILNEAASRTEGAGKAFNGGRVLGALALVYYDEPARRDSALSTAESYLRMGSVSHNHLWFYRLAMESLLRAHEWDGVERYAQALEDFTRAEPLPWSDFFIARGRALAALGHGKRDDATMQELQRLRDEARRLGLKLALPALEQALAST